MKELKLLVGSILVLVLAVTAVEAGTVVVIETWAYDQYSESGTATMYLGENKARVEFVGKENTVQAIFDVENKDAPVVWILEAATESYTKMDKKTAKGIRDKAQQAVEMLQSYMSGLSAEERAETEAKYKKEIRQANDLVKAEEWMKKTIYQKVAGGEKVKAWTCDHFKGIFNKELRKEVWVASWSDLGAEEKDVAVLGSIAVAFPGFAGETAPFSGEKIEGSGDTINGFPVKTVFYEGGNKIIRQEVKEVRKQDLDASLFSVPQTYKEKPPVSG